MQQTYGGIPIPIGQSTWRVYWLLKAWFYQNLGVVWTLLTAYFYTRRVMSNLITESLFLQMACYEFNQITSNLLLHGAWDIVWGVSDYKDVIYARDMSVI